MCGGFLTCGVSVRYGGWRVGGASALALSLLLLSKFKSATTSGRENC